MIHSRIFWAIASPLFLAALLLAAYWHLGDSPRAYADVIPSMANPIWSLSVIFAFIGAISGTLLDRFAIIDKAQENELAKFEARKQQQAYEAELARQKQRNQRLRQEQYGSSSWGTNHVEEAREDIPASEEPEEFTPSKFPIRRSIRTGIGVFFSLLVVNWFVMYWARPVDTGFGTFGLIILELCLIFICFVVTNLRENWRFTWTHAISGGLAIVILFWSIGHSVRWIGEDNAKHLANLANVTIVSGSEANYPRTDEKTIPAFGPQEARGKADRAMNDGNLGTYYDLAECVEQKVKAKRTYVCGLIIPDRRTTQTTDFDITAYITVDPSDITAVGVPVRKTDDGKEIHIAYWPGGWSNANLERHVWKSYQDYYADDFTFETDDNRRPFYTATLNKPPLRFEQAVPQKFITVDAQTGEITEYKLNNTEKSSEAYKLPPIPSWVDRVYSEKTVRKLMEWWGEWQQAPYEYGVNGKENRYKVSGHMNLVFTDEGGMAWQVLMGSWRNDKVIQNVVLFNTRGDSVKAYPAPSGLVTEETVIQQFKESTRNVTHAEPTNLGLYKIYGEPVWIGSLVKEGLADNDSEGYPTIASYAGTSAMRALKSEAANAILGSTPRDAYDQLSVQIATKPLTSGSPSAEAKVEEATGVVEWAEKLYLGTDTGAVINLQLRGDGQYTYRGRITYDNAKDFTKVQAGDTVVITFLNTGKDERAIATVKVIPPTSNKG